MLNRPFKTTCYSLPLTSNKILQIDIKFNYNQKITDELFNDFQRPFTSLEKIGQWGGLAGDMYKPESSKLSILQNGKLVENQVLSWSFDVTRVHPSTALIIQNIIHYLHLNVASVDQLTMRSSLFNNGKPILEELPLDYEPYPFLVNFDIENLQVSVDVDFCEHQEPSAAELFREAWDGWFDVAYYGGFCSEDFPPDETKIFIEDDLRVTSTGIGGVFDDVVIDDAGFYCLINMLQVLHSRYIKIEEVTIE